MLQKAKRKLREERILLQLDDFGYATREQLQLACSLGGDRNAMRILSEMESAKLIGSYREECKVYFVTNRGYGRIGSTKQATKGRTSPHTLMRNDVFLRLGMPKGWRKEVTLDYSEGRIVCDAMYEEGGKCVFVEIDHTQGMRNNYEKIDHYRQLAVEMKAQFRYTPRLLFYTDSEVRRQKLGIYMQEIGVKGEVLAPELK